MTDDLRRAFEVLDKALAGPAPSLLDAFAGLPPPEQPPQHDSHVLDWIKHEAFVETAARTAEHDATMATIRRMHFDQAKREGVRPFRVVREDDSA